MRDHAGGHQDRTARRAARCARGGAAASGMKAPVARQTAAATPARARPSAARRRPCAAAGPMSVRLLDEHDINRRHVRRRGDDVVGELRVLHHAIAINGQLEERIAEPLRGAADDLTFDEQRVDRLADVLRAWSSCAPSPRTSSCRPRDRRPPRHSCRRRRRRRDTRLRPTRSPAAARYSASQRTNGSPPQARAASAAIALRVAATRRAARPGVGAGRCAACCSRPPTIITCGWRRSVRCWAPSTCRGSRSRRDRCRRRARPPSSARTSSSRPAPSRSTRPAP